MSFQIDLWYRRSCSSVTGRLLRLVVFGPGRRVGVFPVYLDNLPEVFDAEVGERRRAILAEAVDGDDAVFRLHLDADVVEPILVCAEHLGDAGKGKYMADRRHRQAACRCWNSGFQCQGRSSWSRVTMWSLIRPSTSAR